jgi:ribosomal protein L9
MEIILLADVKTLGKKGDKVNVNDGYARNFILPKKLGIEATGKNINDLKLQKANQERIAKQILEEAEVLKGKIEKKEVTLSIKVGDGGKIFGSISSKEIAEEVKKQLELEIDKKKMQVANGTIKTLGIHTVAVKVHPKVTAELKIKVVEA